MIPLQPVPIPNQAQPMQKPVQPDNAGLFFQALQARQTQQRDQVMAQKALTDSVMSMASLMEKKREADMENAQGQAMLDLRNRQFSQAQQLQDYLLTATPKEATFGGQSAVVTPGKNGPHVQFNKANSAAVDPSQFSPLIESVHSGKTAPSQAALLLGRGPQKQAFLQAYLAKYPDDSLVSRDTNFAEARSGANFRGGQGERVAAASRAILPNLEKLDSVLKKEYLTGVPQLDQFPAVANAAIAFKSKTGDVNASRINQLSAIAADEIQANFGVGSDKKLDLAMDILRTGNIPQRVQAIRDVQDALKARENSFKGRGVETAAKVMVLSPDGKQGLIPAARLNDYLQAGYKRAN